MPDNPNPDPAQQGNPDPNARPEWLPEKFKDPEALVTSYTEMERRLSEEAQSRRALEDAFSDLSTQFEAAQQQNQNQPDPQQAQDWLAENYGFDQNQLQLMVQLANNVADTKLQAFQQSQQTNQMGFYEQTAAFVDSELKASLPDWDQYREKVSETVKQYPHLIPEDHLSSPVQLRNDLVNVYKLVRADDVEQQAKDAEERAAEFQRMKEQAQTLSGGIGRPMPQSEAAAEWDKIKSAGAREGGY